MIRPLVKLTSSRIWDISSQPACFTAGVMNLVQMSRSERDFFMPAGSGNLFGYFNRKRMITKMNIHVKNIKNRKAQVASRKW